MKSCSTAQHYISVHMQITLQDYLVHVKLDLFGLFRGLQHVCALLYSVGGSVAVSSVSVFSAAGAAVSLSSGHRSEIRGNHRIVKKSA